MTNLFVSFVHIKSVGELTSDLVYDLLMVDLNFNFLTPNPCDNVWLCPHRTGILIITVPHAGCILLVSYKALHTISFNPRCMRWGLSSGSKWAVGLGREPKLEHSSCKGLVWFLLYCFAFFTESFGKFVLITNIFMSLNWTVLLSSGPPKCWVKALRSVLKVRRRRGIVLVP